ncbi:hypothetical protein [Polyangium aurulentum]|uniref:hypothetical protein n=1 Tax=Polyangium aurulentum TaxID=2567896 RepID=UPI0010AE3D82|nr:hypothetical protein [Polyangium aurulentum]UQA56300.1 hypothetical protein E8A73_034030 [Polyangium aurulentum]
MNAAPREPPPPPPDDEAPGADIRARARDFDIAPLVELLSKRFPGRPIVFRSHPSLAPQASVVHDVELSPSEIVITVNLGLRSSTSPLPSYFLDLFVDPAGGDALAAVVEMLDAGLLPPRLATHRIDTSSLFPGDAARARKQILGLAQPASPSTLHWLFSTLFPELRVRVERSPLLGALAADEAVVGEAMLGAATLGGLARVPLNGFAIVLRTLESRTWSDESWGVEAQRRVIRHALPALAGTGAHLRVLLVDTEAHGRLALRMDSHLGMDALGNAASPRILVLFEGRAPDAPGNDDSVFGPADPSVRG